jgi:hypothetical protein
MYDNCGYIVQPPPKSLPWKGKFSKRVVFVNADVLAF